MPTSLFGLLYYSEEEYDAVHKELLQRREEVEKMTVYKERMEASVLGQTQNRLLRAVELLTEWKGKNAKLEEEKQQLLQTIERATEDHKPVVLPREVAAAIETCRNAYLSAISIVTSMEHVSSLFRDYSTPVLDALTVIKDYAQKVIGGGENLLRALVNGYTVEPTEEELQRDAIRKWYQGALKRIKDGTDPDEFAKEAIEEVALYLGGAEILADLSSFCRFQLERAKQN
ncbi:hypothetical protein [Paenibacillus cymbidii]|uniref:hypothetical protein n=1 Tax=Paenibacillus cymbidii TaxID=1639034 RepID=UPI00108046B8|nr:hypothetical protein [Paenibacillus cymbidii]